MSLPVMKGGLVLKEISKQIKRCSNMRTLVNTGRSPWKGTADGLLVIRIVLSEGGCVCQDSPIYKAANEVKALVVS
jgi:hypothetical protein